MSTHISNGTPGRTFVSGTTSVTFAGDTACAARALFARHERMPMETIALRLNTFMSLHLRSPSRIVSLRLAIGFWRTRLRRLVLIGGHEGVRRWSLRVLQECVFLVVQWLCTLRSSAGV